MSLIEVRVTPRSSRSLLEQIGENKYKAYVHAAPVDGKANIELIDLLVDWFGCSKTDIYFRRGETSRNKVIEIKGIDQKLF